MNTSSLGGVEALYGLVVDREMEDGEEVAVFLVVVDLRPLTLGDDVLDVERVPAGPVRQQLGRIEIRRDDVDPRQPRRLRTQRPLRARATSSAAGRDRMLLRMRGRLGTGTQRLVGRRHHVRHCTIVACERAFSSREHTPQDPPSAGRSLKWPAAVAAAAEPSRPTVRRAARPGFAGRPGDRPLERDREDGAEHTGTAQTGTSRAG